MKEDFITKLNHLIQGLDLPIKKEKIEIKQFFSGSAAYYKSTIFITYTNVGVGLKLLDEDLKLLRELGGRNLKYFEKGHIKKQYLLLPEEIVKNNHSLAKWVLKSINSIENKTLK